MRPINGIVQADRSVLCENGLTVCADLPKGVGPSDTVLVCYDYTTNTVTKVIKPFDEDSEDETCEVAQEQDIPLYDFWDSGAL